MKRTLSTLAVLASICLFAVAGQAQTAGFTYQGKLQENSDPATGVYEMQFGLFDQETGGNSQVPALVKPGVGVTNGLFTVELDFGTAVFDGGSRWLEIAVRRVGVPGGASVLAPRQKLTPVPYAVRSLSTGRFEGTIADSQLSPNVAFLSADQTFGGKVHFASASGSFTGNGAGLTNLSVAGTGGAGIVIGRINQLPTSPRTCYAAATGVSDAVDYENVCTTLSPNQEVTASNLSIKLTTAPGTGKSLTFVLRVNGSDTAISTTISGSDTSGNSGPGSVSIPAGSELSIRVQIEGTAATSSALFGWATK